MNTKKIIELIQAEINKLEDANPKETSWNDVGVIQGLEKAIEIIKVSAAIEVVQGSIMHNEEKMQEYLLNLNNGTMQKEYALIGMSKCGVGYAATCTEFGDEKDGDRSFQVGVAMQGAESLFDYVSECWNECKRVAVIECKGFDDIGFPINPVMIDYQER